jgi:hypothetical protein
MSDIIRPRLEKILALHGQGLLDAARKRESKSQKFHSSAKDLIQQFADMDPTLGKSRTQWMVKTYIQDKKFKLEDLGRVHAALLAFKRFKPQLSPKKRELSKLTSLRELETLVTPFVQAEERAKLARDISTITGREFHRLEEMKAREESRILQEVDGLMTIAIPMTKFASQWWGRGTQWSTSAEKSNAFARCHKEGPLIILVCLDGAKFQMHVTRHSFQFIDNTDRNVGEHTIRERWNEFKSLFYWAVQRNKQVLCSVPEEYITSELCRLAVAQDGWAIKYIPENQITPELCRIAVEQDRWVLYFLPEKYKTPEINHLFTVQAKKSVSYNVAKDKKALVSPMQPEWCLDILQGLGSPSSDIVPTELIELTI